jgi:two-component system phosphate regulon response regulator PhoB
MKRPKKLIMAVEDEPSLLEFYKLILTRHGFEYISTCDSRESVEIAKTWLPDLILMDMVMPSYGGDKAIRMIKSQNDTKNIPIIVISGAGSDWAQRGLAAGAVEYLTKPFSLNELLDCIGSVLRNIELGIYEED